MAEVIVSWIVGFVPFELMSSSYDVKGLGKGVRL